MLLMLITSLSCFWFHLALEHKGFTKCDLQISCYDFNKLLFPISIPPYSFVFSSKLKILAETPWKLESPWSSKAKIQTQQIRYIWVNKCLNSWCVLMWWQYSMRDLSFQERDCELDPNLLLSGFRNQMSSGKLVNWLLTCFWRPFGTKRALEILRIGSRLAFW